MRFTKEQVKVIQAKAIMRHHRTEETRSAVVGWVWGFVVGVVVTIAVGIMASNIQ